MTDPGALVAFLRVRLDEKQEKAQGLLRRARQHQIDCRDPAVLGRPVPGWGDWPEVQRLAAHVLREVEAHRRIVDEYADSVAGGFRFTAAALEFAVQCLALPHDQHPDWREEWRP